MKPDPYAKVAALYNLAPVFPATWAYTIMARAGVRSFADVGCGTGKLLRMMRAFGCKWRFHGVDVSRAMIAEARRSANPRLTGISRKRITWRVQDMRQPTRERFDAIGCFGDAINHLLRERDVLEAFRAAARSLDANGPGLYIFDSIIVNTQSKVQKHWTLEDTARKLDARVRTRPTVFETRCTVTNKKTGRHHTSVVRERIYRDDVFVRLLKRAGFEVRHYESWFGHGRWIAQLADRKPIDKDIFLPQIITLPAGVPWRKVVRDMSEVVLPL